MEFSTERHQGVSCNDLRQHEFFLLVGLAVGALEPRKVIPISSGFSPNLNGAIFTTLKEQKRFISILRISVPRQVILSFYHSTHLVAVQTYDKTTFSTRPMKVEQGCFTYVAHFPHSLNHSFPCYCFVCLKKFILIDCHDLIGQREKSRQRRSRH